MEREWRVNPECPNAANPFHRCADYCALKSPAAAAAKPRIDSPKSDQNGDRSRTHDEKRRARRGGSGGLPLYIFLQNGTAGESRKVDPRCANASNPFHVCAEYCFAKLNETDRREGNRREGNKTPSFSSRHSSSSSSSVENDVKLGENRRVDPRCVNASNPYHVCADYCFNKSHEISPEEPGTPVANGVKMGMTSSNETDRAEGVENGVKIEDNRRADPRCVNASNPFHVCADYCFNRSTEMNHKEGGKSAAREAKEVLNTVERRDVHPNCVNASNPFHKCADYCFKKLNEAT